MKPIQFKYANRQLGAPSASGLLERCDRRSPLELHVEGIDPLPVWTDGEQCVSCWRISLWERLAALLFGRVWLAVLSGSTQPAVCVTAARSYLKEDAPSARCCYLRGLTPLGIFNTVCGCLFGQVLVRVVDTDTGRMVRWYWDAAVKHPPEAA